MFQKSNFFKKFITVIATITLITLNTVTTVTTVITVITVIIVVTVIVVTLYSLLGTLGAVLYNTPHLTSEHGAVTTGRGGAPSTERRLTTGERSGILSAETSG